MLDFSKNISYRDPTNCGVHRRFALFILRPTTTFSKFDGRPHTYMIFPKSSPQGSGGHRAVSIADVAKHRLKTFL